MGKTENPAGDSETGDANRVTADLSTAATKTVASRKGTKSSIGERVLIGIIVTVVIAVAIFGVVFTLVRESRRANKSNNNISPVNLHNGDPVTEKPFKVEESLFTSNETKPYVSMDELRQDIDALARTFANNVIMQEANRYNDQLYFDPENVQFMGAMEDAAPDRSQITATTAKEESGSGGSSGVFEGVDDFETYQHEAGVIKNDLVKSNGAYVFVANNNRINILDVNGNLYESMTIASAGGEINSISINALLMSPGGDKLIVIASDYGQYDKAMSIINGHRQTQVTIFEIVGSQLTEISQTFIDGYNIESYIIGNNVHIVTRMTLNKWGYFDDHLYRWKFDEYLTNEEYVAEATKIAEEIIPDFIDEVLDFVTEGDEIILSRLIGFPGSSIDYQTVNQVYSFDISEAGDEDGIELSASKSLVLTPGNNANVYATTEWIWVTDTNFVWHLEKQDYMHNTMILGFRLDGASSNFATLGTFPGEILSQFSIDFKKEDGKEYVRVAVTQNFFNNFWFPMPMPRPSLDFEVANDPFEETEAGETFTEIEEESRTLNEVIIFEIPEASESQEVTELVKLGSVEVGKKHETITAMRFFDDISYVVTFERTDPFYVLDLSNPRNPEILGELEVPGFSEFMHPIKKDNSMLLTVGKDADDNGFVTGLQISIFDSTTPNDPKLVSRLVIESATSSASWDERAFRYVQVDDVGRLIIPLYSYGWDPMGKYENSFDGFAVFGVDLNRTDMITREIDINHWQPYDWEEVRCYCFLPQRSLVFDGNLMTMKASTVTSTNLVSEEIQWSLSLQGKNCC